MSANQHDAASDDMQLGTLLSDAVRLLRRDFYERAKGLKLTPALGRLLYHIHRSDNASQVELAAKLEVTPVTLSRMVDRLVQAKYVRRAADSNDRRVYRLQIDRAGLPLVDRLLQMSKETSTRALRGLSKTEQDKLAKLLVALCNNLANDDDRT